MPSVYFIKNITNGLFYIGSTKDFEKRIITHKRQLKRGKHHNKFLQRDYDAQHELVFFDTIETPDLLSARQLEERLITLFITTGKIYNIGIGFDNMSNNPDKDKVSKQISVGVKNYLSNFSEEELKVKMGRQGIKNPMWGKTHSPEARNKISVKLSGRVGSLKGIKWGEQRKANFKERLKTIDRTGVNNSFYGKSHSIETRKILSDKLKGIKPPNEKVISINGDKYRSMTEASRVLGIPVPTISWRVKSKNRKYTDWFLVP